MPAVEVDAVPVDEARRRSRPPRRAACRGRTASSAGRATLRPARCPDAPRCPCRRSCPCRRLRGSPSGSDRSSCSPTARCSTASARGSCPSAARRGRRHRPSRTGWGCAVSGKLRGCSGSRRISAAAPSRSGASSCRTVRQRLVHAKRIGAVLELPLGEAQRGRHGARLFLACRGSWRTRGRRSPRRASRLCRRGNG